MKIVWLSNAPWAKTGYGSQTRLFLPLLQEMGHDVAIASVWGIQGGNLNLNGAPIMAPGHDNFGNDIIQAHTLWHGAKMFISLLDAWVMNPDQFRAVKWVPWFPIDQQPAPKLVLEKVSQAYRRIVMSKFGLDEINKAGLDAYYVPHGVDTEIYKPHDKRECRERLGLPVDAYIVGMVAANKGAYPSRKAFTWQIMAFREFQRKHKDAVLYLHTNKGDGGDKYAENLPEFCEFSGLEVGKDVIFPNQYNYTTGLYQDKFMAELYSCFDVHMLVSMGEGFGIPTLEAQACGCPVITSGWTASKELCFSGHIVDQKDSIPFYTPTGGFQRIPFLEAIERKLHLEYKNPSSREEARAGAMAYDARVIAKNNWKPMLADLELQIENEVTTHVHRWAEIGMYTEAGEFSVPCKHTGCTAELVIHKNGIREIIQNGYPGTINGVKMDIADDPGGGVSKIVMREVEQIYKPDVVDFQPGDWVIDIGAQVGIVSIYLAKQYPDINILAVEPADKNYERLLRNIEANGVQNVTPIHAAVTGDGRNVTITGNLSQNSGGASMWHGGDLLYSGPSWTLDKLITNLCKIDRLKLLKIDCEGAEYEILQSTTPEVLRRIDVLRGEFHRGKQLGNPDELLEYVRQYIPDTEVEVSGNAEN